MWFDSHCHLHLVAEDAEVDEVINSARAQGVGGMLTVGIDVPSSRASVSLAERFGLWAAVGLHPNSADDFSPEVEGALDELLTRERVVAVGESGLDFYRAGASALNQRRAFSSHVSLAKSHGAALVIHTRESLAEALDQLALEGPPQRVVFHCWSGGAAELERALELGAFISFAGNVSFKNAGDLRAVGKLVPAERLLIETDSPFLAPSPKRGRPNRPEYLPLVGEALAAARGEDVESLMTATEKNAHRLLGVGA
ncbi:TatD family hydrolase [soil metagenome]